MTAVLPPSSEAELLLRARSFAGRTIADLGSAIGRPAPADLSRHKGWVGHALEVALGATAASRDEPDFVALGIEMKTLPVDARGKPVESTFVCTLEPAELGRGGWEESRVWRKLARVLWVPTLGERRVPLGERVIGSAFLWRPTGEEQALLRADWEELVGVIGRGDVDAVTAHLGQVLQVRPKAAHSRVRRRAVDSEGMIRDSLPRGFYLRPAFTASILRRHVRLPA